KAYESPSPHRVLLPACEIHGRGTGNRRDASTWVSIPLRDKARWAPSCRSRGRSFMRARRRVFPGRHEQVAQARRFVGRALEDCPVSDEAILCVSELATNALLHTASGTNGEFEVIVQRGESWVRVAVCDKGSPKIPTARTLDAISEDGRGLGLVAL